MATFVQTNPLNKMEDLADRLAEKLDVPFIGQDQLLGYLGVQIIAAALDHAQSADREKLTEGLRTLKVTSGPALDVVPADEFSFDESGRITPTFGAIAQWQTVDGELQPCTIAPEKYAECKPKW
jgi:ABC-type branched-subunit amino acid transport system substrate-binding protein